jgi:ArsR family transcriptional regulator
MADPIRLRILALIDPEEQCVGNIYSIIGIKQPAVSKHLGILRRAGLVEARRQGLWIYYRVATPEDAGISAVLTAILSALRDSSQTREDQRTLARRAAPVVKPQAWHGIDPEFLD